MTGVRKWVASVPFLVSLIALPILSPMPAFAADTANVSTVSEISDKAVNGVTDNGANDGSNMGKVDGSSYIPDTSIEDANHWVNDKGEDLVGLGGTIAEPISIIGFMLGLFITLAGAFTKSNHITKGLLVMAISICVYVGTVFAPELVQYFSNWLSA